MEEKNFLGLDGLKHFWTKAKTWIINRITTEVTAKIAEIVANAPEDLDTLKEISDWISSHANDASAMNTAILANTEAISGKADKIHTHTKSEITDFPTSLPANGGTATTAESANKIVPKYTKTLDLTTVTSSTIKYIKIADCTWTQTGTLQVHLDGNAIQDTLVINFGGGHSEHPMLCGYYIPHGYCILSAIATKSLQFNSNYSIYIKIKQETTCNVQVALLKGNCTINITESTTAPTNIREWAVHDGLFGNLTGNVSGSSGSASKLTTARKTYVTLGTASTTTTRDWSGDTTIPVNGVLQVEHGGTGKTTANAAANAFINSLTTGESVPEDNDYYVSQYVNGGTTTTTYHRRPISKLWEYIKGKISSVLGLTENNYGGTATKATQDGNGNVITSTYVKKSGDTLTGQLTTAKGASQTALNGIKLADNSVLTGLANNVLLLNNNALRFSDVSDWDYNKWAGLKYVSSTKQIDLGIADNSDFTANTTQTGGTLKLSNITKLRLNSGSVDLTWNSTTKSLDFTFA